MNVRVAICFCACAFESACLFPGLDGLTGADASTESGTDSGSSDSSSDTTSEAAIDASCGDGSLYCDKLCTKPTFCEDFDHDVAFGQWQSTATSSGGVVTYDGVVFASAPSSAKCTTPAVSGSGQVYAGLERSFSAASRATVAFDVRIEQPSSSAQTGIVQFTLTPPPPYDYATAAIDIQNTFSINQTTHLLDGGYQGNTTAFSDAAVPFGSWHRLELDMDFAAKTVSLAVDGVVVASDTLNAGFVPGSTSNIAIGQFYANGPQPAWTIHIDDVVVNTTP